MTRCPVIHLPIIDDAKALARRVPRAPDPAAPPPVSIATRRDLFGTVGAMMLLTAAEAGQAKAAELDGDLLALCAEAGELDKETDRLYDIFTEGVVGSPVESAAYAQLHAVNGRWHETIRAIAAMPARTPEGLRAKAAMTLAAMPQEQKDDPDPFVLVAMSLFDDMLGRAGV
jgi:hypothetical protein